MERLPFILCPTCKGTGVLPSANPAITPTCTTCGQSGGWLEAGKIHLTYPLSPTQFRPITPPPWQAPWFAAATTYTSGALCLASFLLMVASSHFDPATLFWQNGPAPAVFGISGLVGMWSLSRLKSHHTSTRSLHDLVAEIQSDSSGILSLEHFSNPRLKELLHECGIVAAALQQNTISEWTLLLAVLRTPRIQGMLGRLELSAVDITEHIITNLPAVPVQTGKILSILPEVPTRIYAGINVALENDFPYLDVEDILLAYLKEPGVFADIFTQCNLAYASFSAISKWYAADQDRNLRWAFWLDRGRSHSKGYMNKAWTALPTPFLDAHSTDLTRRAANGAVSSAITRTEEITRCLEVLSRTKRNSALLVGEPGVGKHTLLGGLALRMLEDSVPPILHDKRLVSLDLASLLSQTDQAEANTQTVINEVLRAGNVILAIPDIQLLIGTSGGALDAASVITSALTNGSIQVISTASYADYHRYVESNPTFSAALDTIEVKEVSVEQAIAILEEEAPQLEGKQKVFLTYPAIEAAAMLAKRYLPDQALPNSALTILDEAASSAALRKEPWVRKEDIERAIEKRTAVPVTTASGVEADALLNLEQSLHSRIIGQQEAIVAVSEALRRARAGLHEGNRPLASFLFVGPTGVGKTELAKAVSDIYFGQTSEMIRLDMSEYQDARSAYRLIGAPAADSSSYTEGGSLTQPIREHPFSLVLLDELEKAYPDVLNLFLQVLDDGRVTENTGRTVHFSNTIVVATSNAANAEVGNLSTQNLTPEAMQSQTLGILSKHFRPEFLNRFDRIVAFHPLTQAEIVQVTQLMLTSLQQKLLAQRYTITFAPEVAPLLAQKGFDPIFGARPLRRVVQDSVEGMIARRILEGTLKPGDTLQVTTGMLQ